MRVFFLVLAVLLIAGGFTWQAVSAQKTVRFTATINPGALLADIRDAMGRSIAEPVVEFGKIANSVDCRTISGLSAQLGSDNQRLYVDNPKAAYDGWVLTLAPADSGSAKWQSASGEAFDLNDSAAGGCVDGDGDSVGGLMVIDPSSARLDSDCLECTTKNVFVSKDAASLAETKSVTILRANQNSDIVGSWYVTGINIQQTVPEGVGGDEFYVDMVLTAVAT